VGIQPIRTALTALLLLAAPAWADPPTVVSTDPANGATGVAPDLAHISLTFSTTMGNGFSFSGLSGSWNIEWSGDHRTLNIDRSPGSPPWAQGQALTITLNPPPYISFFDTEGNPLPTYTFSFSVGGSPDPGAPTVQSTNPANGAVEVDRELETVTITFSKRMADQVNVTNSGGWPISASTPRTWSADGRTLSLSRDDAGTPLEPSTAITLHLNANGAGFEDMEGKPLGAYSLTFTTSTPGADEKPTVVDRNPPLDEPLVGVFVDRVSVTFSKPMESAYDIQCTTGNWLVGAGSWSSDRRTFTLTRADPDRLLPPGERIDLVLNASGDGFEDTYGNALDPYTFSFMVEARSRLIQVRPEDSNHDFSWPYYLWVPDGLPVRTTLLVEPNNSGFANDFAVLQEWSALSLIGWRAGFASRINAPLLVPAFPRPMTHWRIYTHALDRDSLTNSIEDLERIDLQLIEMIDDARQRLANLGFVVDEKVFMMGFSASGQFTNRFAILHPERIRAAAAGSPGGWPLAPVASWQGETLDYHVGIADVASLLGEPLDMTAVRAVPLYLYMGDADTNDSVPYSDGYDEDQRELVNRLFGTTPVERWAHAEEIYETAGMNSTFVLYPGVEHTITNEMFDDVAAFFNAHKQQRFVRIRRPTRRLGPASGSAMVTAAALVQPVHRWDASRVEPMPPLHEDPPPISLPPADERCHRGASYPWAPRP